MANSNLMTFGDLVALGPLSLLHLLLARPLYPLLTLISYPSWILRIISYHGKAPLNF